MLTLHKYSFSLHWVLYNDTHTNEKVYVISTVVTYSINCINEEK